MSSSGTKAVGRSGKYLIGRMGQTCGRKNRKMCGLTDPVLRHSRSSLSHFVRSLACFFF
jgi:hypothetical protein